MDAYSFISHWLFGANEVEGIKIKGTKKWKNMDGECLADLQWSGNWRQNISIPSDICFSAWKTAWKGEAPHQKEENLSL